MRAPPADLTTGDFALRSTSPDSPPADADLFRTISAGIPPAGMPSFAQLPEADRWALVDYVKSLSPAFLGEPAAAPLDLGAEPPVRPEEGASIYRAAGCASCHGDGGRGDGSAVSDLAEKPPDLTLGPGVFEGGATRRDVLRTLLTGMPGTPMPSYAEAGFSRRQLWALAAYVSDLANRGRGDWVTRWRRFFGGLGLAGAPKGDDPPRSRPPPFPAADGCLRCHEGIESINAKMQPVLDTMAGGRRGASCALCHDGDPDGPDERAAHRNLVANPGSLWVVGLGEGCARCHATAGSLSTFQGHPLPTAVGGRLMSVVSRTDDPTGATGGAHAYRVPRGLMAAELGKATNSLAANGLIPKGGPAVADVPVDDPDGASPAAGSEAYKSWVSLALDRGFLRRVAWADVIPAAPAGSRQFEGLARGAVGDMFRKDCARCHLWDRGWPGAGGRYRSEGCSACHVLYGDDGRSRSHDPTLAGEGPGHPLQHRITATIPSSQCAHCHWRGGGYYSDLHYKRGLECQDCHDSVDVHGDGNVYPTMHLQVSIACQDCHGTARAYPWELPVGYGSPVQLPGQRGVVRVDGIDHLLSSRGNAEARWVRRGETALLISLDGRERPIPLLKDLHLRNAWSSDAARVAMDAIPRHEEKLECLACHVPRAVQCQGCHVESDFGKKAIDWVASASARRSPFEPAGRVETPGVETFASSPHALVEPALGVDLNGRVTGLVPGCLLSLRARDADGGVDRLGATFTSEGLPSATLAPLIPHQVNREARSCESCHTSSMALGYGVGRHRDEPPEPAPVPERQPIPGEEGRFIGAHGVTMFPGPSSSAGGGIEASDRFDVNRLVTRAGRQIKSLADPGERPLSSQERNVTEREGICLACHRLSGTPAWASAVRRFGRTDTPEAHDRAVGALLEQLLRPGR